MYQAMYIVYNIQNVILCVMSYTIYIPAYKRKTYIPKINVLV